VTYRTAGMASTTKADRRIVSITSAPGWAALFAQPDDSFEDDQVITLAAWALVEEDGGQTRLVGLVQKSEDEDTPVGMFMFADEHRRFAGYRHQGLKTKPPE
jgi:hypothetical protein